MSNRSTLVFVTGPLLEICAGHVPSVRLSRSVRPLVITRRTRFAYSCERGLKPAILETCSMGLLFAFGVLSFHDARPRGVSEMHFKEDDQWSVGDLLRHLHYR
jgi:hypothetical protein